MLETFHLLWLDTNISSTDDENLNIQKRLQSIVNQFQVFATLDEFIKYVQKIPKGQNIITVLTAGNANEMLTKLHNLAQLSAFYLYVRNENEPSLDFTKQNKKVRTIFAIIHFCCLVFNSVLIDIISCFRVLLERRKYRIILSKLFFFIL